MDMFKKARKQVKAAVKDVQQQVNQISGGSFQQSNSNSYQSTQQHPLNPPQQPPQQLSYPAYGQQIHPSPPGQQHYGAPVPTHPNHAPPPSQEYFPPPHSYHQAPQQFSPAQTPGSFQAVSPGSHHQPEKVSYQILNAPPTPFSSPSSPNSSLQYQNVPSHPAFQPQPPAIPLATRPYQPMTPASDPVHEPEGQYQALAVQDTHHSQTSDQGISPNLVKPVQQPMEHYPAIVSPWKTKCPAFEEVLSDIVPFYELSSEALRSYSMPVPAASVVLICEYCFLTILAPHPHLANGFTLRAKDNRPKDKTHPQISFERIGGCALAFPRIRSTVINQCIPQRSIKPYTDDCKLDVGLGPCQGGPTTGDYYACKAINTLSFCRSCYEWFIVGTPFRSNFFKQHMADTNKEWFCEMGYSGFCNRTLMTAINKSRADFGHFAAAMNKKLNLLPCSGEGIPMFPAGSGKSLAYRSVIDNSGVFCSSCFHDYVAGTPAEKQFGQIFELDQSQKGSLCCDLASPFSKYAMTTAVSALDFSLWLDPIQAHHSLQLCPSIAGSDERIMPSEGEGWQVWYHFKNHPQIECCPRCYRTNVAVLEAKSLFVPITRPLQAGIIRQCYLSPSKDMTASESWDPMDYENTTFWRGNYIRNLLRYGHFAGNDFTVAITEIKKIAALPKPCGSELRRFKPVNGRKWLGHVATNPNDLNDATIIMCEECHLYSVKGTPLEALLSNDLTHLTYENPEGHRCSTWSKQCKRRLRTACETSNFAAYAQYHHRREEAYENLWRSMNELKPLGELMKGHAARINAETQVTIQMGAIRLAQQMNAQQNAVISGIGGSVAEASATDYGYRYGNSTVGMGYLTHNGASAALAHQNAANSRYNPPLDLNLWRNASVEQLTAEYKRRLDVQKQLQEDWKHID